MAQRKRPEKTVWAPVPELDFEVRLRYLPRSELQAMLQRATDNAWDRRAGQNREQLNPERLMEEWAGVILDWRGLTREVYGKLIPIDPAEYPEEIPCTQEYKLELLREAYGFDVVVRQICTDLARFREEQLADEIKN